MQIKPKHSDESSENFRTEFAVLSGFILFCTFVIRAELALFVMFCVMLTLIIRKAHPYKSVVKSDDLYRRYVRPVGRAVAWAPVALCATVVLFVFGIAFAPFWIVVGTICATIKYVREKRAERKASLAAASLPLPTLLEGAAMSIRAEEDLSDSSQNTSSEKLIG